jgi:hypothetical protein
LILTEFFECFLKRVIILSKKASLGSMDCEKDIKNSKTDSNKSNSSPLKSILKSNFANATGAKLPKNHEQTSSPNKSQQGSVYALSKWAGAMESVARSTIVKKATLQTLNRVADNLDSRINTIRQKNKDLSKIFKQTELFFIRFNIIPKNNRTKSFKVFLSWLDIEKFFEIESFLKYFHLILTNHKLGDPQSKLDVFWSKVNPRNFFTVFLRYILSFVKIQSYNIYFIPFIAYQNGVKTIYMRNIFQKYIEEKNIRHFGLMDS